MPKPNKKADKCPEEKNVTEHEGCYGHKYEDSVARHRKWQASLNKDEFLDRVMRAHRESSRKND